MSPMGKFYGKLIIDGVLECLTGIHIGTGKEVMEIGGVDTPVVRDPLTREPYLPGSSLKGKLRSLLEKQEFATKGAEIGVEGFFSSIIGSGGQRIRHHECNNTACTICRLFGASKDRYIKESRPARLFVSDAHMTAKSKKELEQIDTGLYLTELKFENTLDRITAAASPRQIERVPRGTEFNFTLTYTQGEEKTTGEFRSDLKGIFNSLLLLQDDGIGGSVSRGYGRVGLKNFVLRHRSLSYYKEGDKKGETIVHQGEEELRDFMKRVLDDLSS
jgi:CRISPR-associated protein Csm3